MASGKAIITTNLGSIPRIIEINKTGIIIKPGDIEALSASIMKILENKDLIKQLGKRARRVVEQNFDWKNYVDKLCDIFEKLL